MRVAIVTHYWKNSPGGGVLAYLTGLVSELINKNVSIKVIFNQGDDPSNYLIKGPRFLFPFKTFWKLRAIKPEIVHAQGTWYSLAPGYLYKILYKAKLICTFHSSPGNRKPPFYEKALMQILLNRCDYVTFVSQALKEEKEATEGYKFKKSAITYAGTNLKAVLEADIINFRQKHQIKDNSIVLLAQAFTANKLKAEGAKLLIRSIDKMQEKYPNLILVLTREGIFSDEIKEYSKKLGLDNKVVFTGDVGNPYIPLAVCNIYTHTSLSDGGVPLAILEAMSIGKPIIATNIGGIPEAIINLENGLLVKPDVDEIIRAIELLLTNADMAEKLGQNARNATKQKFSWSKSADIFISIYGGKSN